jgi:hypothetical protein
MRLTVNVLCISNPHRFSEEYIYEMYLKNYNVVEGIMCVNGDCLIVAILSDGQLADLANIVDITLLTTADCTEDNIEFLCDKIYSILFNYNKYYNQ